jgi:hypothetical protein
MPSLLNDVTHWWNRAEEARGLTEHLTMGDARRLMLGLAQDYDRLAQRGQNRRLYPEWSRTLHRAGEEIGCRASRAGAVPARKV